MAAGTKNRSPMPAVAEELSIKAFVPLREEKYAEKAAPISVPSMVARAGEIIHNAEKIKLRRVITCILLEVYVNKRMRFIIILSTPRRKAIMRNIMVP